ncbi:NAD(P)-dependent oxidoreductase [Bailinhaonella thermotolerans]|uniref:NAD(P)-dependent oxidoreductase n=1 Tax=Bailinhaonella thermotolerans TaxID=1070861 RepID=A0A3A4ASW1_9ACTN|nr:NAD(P)-binding domain-containing protein [Bailinhaonella thermotolerans]RJL24438.1 NAD(P)-dependent oxidoreductase [Bailinhaonella thermotolerans]
MSDKTPVTVIGLGLMGRVLAQAFLDAGHPTTVWNRTPEKAADLVARGAKQAATVAEAVEAGPLTIICVLTHDSVEDVLAAAGGSIAGRTIVNLTNGTPEQARKAEALAAGSEYLDGGIMAVPQMIAKPGALILYSGHPDAFERYRETFEVLAEARYLGDDAGRAALYDLAMLSAMYGMYGGFAHALAMVRAEGVSATEFEPYVSGWLQAMFQTLPAAAAQVDSGDFVTDVSSLAMNDTAFPNFIEASRALGLRPDVLLPMRDLIRRAVEAGHGADSVIRIVDMIPENS